VKVEFSDHVMPAPTAGGYATVPRSLRTPFVDQWNARPGDAEKQAERLREELGTAIRVGRAHELIPLTGQTAGMIDEVLPAGEVVRRMVREAEEALRAARARTGA
jgi:enoyl-[acyl-carrier protein] reductase II